MAIRSQDLETLVATLQGTCGVCYGELVYAGDLDLVSFFWCGTCGMEYEVAFGGER